MTRHIENERDIRESADAERSASERHERPGLPRSSRERLRDQPVRLAVSERMQRTLGEIARFRTVAEKDLLVGLYEGNREAIRNDLKALAAQGLLQRRRACFGQQGQYLNVVVLSKAGLKYFAGLNRHASTQALYSGFVKPSEVAHDAAIYRMFKAESARLELAGARITRIVLDYELKRLVYSPLAKDRRISNAERPVRQAAVAAQNGLKVIRGHVVLPDLRIEFEGRDGIQGRVDLELATEHYHGSHLRDKAEAGFRIYVADGSGQRLTRVMEDREIMATILSL